jgi:hypothetical protein
VVRRACEAVRRPLSLLSGVFLAVGVGTDSPFLVYLFL